MFHVLWIRIEVRVSEVIPQTFMLHIRTNSIQKCGWCVRCYALISLKMQNFCITTALLTFPKSFIIIRHPRFFYPIVQCILILLNVNVGCFTLYNFLKVMWVFFIVKARMFNVWPEHGRLFTYNKIQTAYDIRVLFMLSWQQGWISKSWAPGQEPKQGPPIPTSLPMNQWRDSLSPHLIALYPSLKPMLKTAYINMLHIYYEYSRSLGAKQKQYNLSFPTIISALLQVYNPDLDP